MIDPSILNWSVVIFIFLTTWLLVTMGDTDGK